MDEWFFDRRPHAAPGESDFVTPLTRSAVHEANERIRAATPDYHMDRRNTRIDTLAVQRHRSRRSGSGDFDSIGHYLEFMQGQG